MAEPRAAHSDSAAGAFTSGIAAGGTKLARAAATENGGDRVAHRG